jgi:hypothetical protein
MMLELHAVPLVDNHCHGLWLDEAPIDAATLRHRFSECAGEPFPPDHTATTVHYQWALRQMAEVLECEPDEDAVLGARADHGQAEVDRRFMAGAGITWLLVDDGFPEPVETVDRDRQAERTGCRIGWVERVEVAAAGMIGEADSFAAFDERLAGHLASARDRGVCGLKSVAAYRSGLAIGDPGAGEAEACFRRMREAGETRVVLKPLVDHIVLRAMDAARDQNLPVQFHTGYGDADADLLLADPLHLRGLLHRYPGVPVVMLHAAYPYTAKLGVLVHTYANAYLDISYAIPFLTSRELASVTREALACAPTARIMYSSDGVGMTEHYWLGSVRGRRALGAALGDLVAAGDLDEEQAMRAAHRIMHENAERIYGLNGSTA